MSVHQPLIFPDLISPTPLASSAVQISGPSVSVVQTKNIPENIEGHWMPLKQQLKEISKWNTTLISCTAQV